MVRSGQILAGKSWGKKAAGLVLLCGLVVLTVSFSAPKQYSAHAANWLDQVFGNYKPANRPRYRRRRYSAPKIVYLPSQRTRTRARRAYGIGRIDNSRVNRSRVKNRKKARRTYKIPKSRSGRYLSRRGTYRTMCVRTCDGYFFPVSFAARKGRLRKDASACKSSCGAPARLYYYPNPGGKIKDMISYRGKKKYKRLKNAFLFKKEFVADCRCKPEPWSTASKQRHQKYAVAQIKRKKRVASRKSRAKKWRTSSRKNRRRARKSRRYSRLSKKRRNRYVRTVGSKKRARRKSSKRSRRVRTRRRTTGWSF